MGTPILGQERFLAVDVNDSETVPGEKWIKMAMQTGGGMGRASNKVDTTHKDDLGFTSEVVTTKTWTFSAEGNENIHNMALRHLAQKWKSQTTIDVKIHIKIVTEVGTEFVGFATLDNFDLTIGNNEVVAYTISFTGRGVLTER